MRPFGISDSARKFAPFAFACVGYFVLARVGSLAGLTGHTGSPFWIASGLGLALALDGRRSLMLGLVCGSFLAAKWSLGMPQSIMVALSDSSSAYLAAWIYRKLQGRWPWLGVLQDALALSFAAVTVSAFAAVTAASAISYSYGLNGEKMYSVVLTWFLGDALGFIIGGPFFISIFAWFQRPARPSTKNVMVLLAILISATLVCFAVLWFPERKGAVFLFLLVPAVAAYWSGAAEVKSAVLIVVCTLIILIGIYDMSFVRSSTEVNRWVYAMFVAGLGLSWLVVVTEAAEKLRGLPLIVFAAAGFIAARLFTNMEKAESAKQQLRADQVVMAGDNLVSAHADNFLEALRPAAYVIQESPQITSVAWDRYCKSVRLTDHFAGLRGMGVVYPAKSESLDDFFAKSRQQGVPLSGLIRGADEVPGGEHLVFSLWHSTTTDAPIGLDFSTLKLHRASAEIARDTGQAQLVPCIPEFIDRKSKNELGRSLIVFWPVYRSGSAPRDREARRRDIVGWLIAVFELSGIKQNVLDKIPIAADVAVYRGTEVKPEALLAEHNVAPIKKVAEYATRTSTLSVLSNRFTLVWKVPIDPNAAQHLQTTGGAVMIIIAGAFLSTLVLNLRNTAHKVEREVVNRTRELQLSNLALMQQRAEVRKLAHIAMEAKNPMILAGGDLKIQWINQSFTDFYGYTIEEVFGKRTKEILIGPESDLSAFECKREVFYAKKEPISYEILHYTKSGAKVWVAMSIRAILDTKGEIERIIGVITDLTATKNHQRELEEAKAKAEQASEAKSNLIANVSHELRTPLNVIMGNLQLLQAGKFGPLEESQRSALRSVESSSQHLLDLISDLLDVSKAWAGMLTLQKGPVNITHLMENVIGFMRVPAQGKNLTLTMALKHQTDLIEADELRLKQIVINLLSNAVKYTSAGGTINVRLEETAQPWELQIHVSDTGIGIHHDDHERIFLEFEQVDNIAKSGGTGLGLPIARRLAKMHDGDLTVVSESGRGSTFTFRLPIRRPSTPPAPAYSPPANPELPVAQPAASGALILAVDDFELNLEVLCMYLQGEGYRVLKATSGESAIAQAQEHHPDLILMDVKMSGMDGLEAIRLLKAESKTCGIPVISLTAFAGESDTKRCFEAGATDYLSKPIDFPELGRKLTRHLTTRV